MSVIAESVRAGHTVPSEWYTSEEIFRHEQERILRRAWHYVTCLDQLPDPGSALPWTLGGVPIVLVRTDDTIRGYVNICRHRAHPVVTEAGTYRSLTYDYHGWSYDLGGALRKVPKANGPVPFDESSVCLPPIQVEVWGPMVWANVDLDAPSLHEWADGMDARLRSLGCDVDDTKHCAGHSWEIGANWKVFQDNTIECYHCPTSHPELAMALVMDPAKQDLQVGGRYWIHHTIPFRDSIPEGPTWGPNADGVSLYHYNWIFPTTYLQHSGKGFDIGTLDVLAPDRLRFRHVWFGPKDTPDQTAAAVQAMLEQDATINQDVGICERVQACHESGMAPAGLLIPGREALLTHFYELIVDLMETDAMEPDA